LQVSRVNKAADQLDLATQPAMGPPLTAGSPAGRRPRQLVPLIKSGA